MHAPAGLAIDLERLRAAVCDSDWSLKLCTLARRVPSA